MTPEDARTVIAECLAGIAPEVDLDAADPTEPLADELDLDSMDLQSLYEEIHRRTGLDLPEADYGALVTLDGAVAYLVDRSG
jgi:acyl carrier protein